MYDFRKFFINGVWVSPQGRREHEVINPATEQPIGKILLGTADDVDAAVKAARGAFESFSQTTREERIALLERIIKVYQSRMQQVAAAISDEMGAPMKFALHAQAGSGLGHFASDARRAERFRIRRVTRDNADSPRTRGRVRPDHALELADQSNQLQGRAGAGRRLHRGAQAK